MLYQAVGIWSSGRVKDRDSTGTPLCIAVRTRTIVGAKGAFDKVHFQRRLKPLPTGTTSAVEWLLVSLRVLTTVAADAWLDVVKPQGRACVSHDLGERGEQ